MKLYVKGEIKLILMGVCQSACTVFASSQSEAVLYGQNNGIAEAVDDGRVNSNVIQSYIRGHLARKKFIYKKIRVLGKLLMKLPDLPWFVAIKNSDGLYTGQMRNQQKHGLGELESDSGIYYYGYFINDSFSGLGLLKDSTKVYEGNFKAGKKSGYGIFKSPEFIYAGMFQDDLYHGPGTETWNNMCKYTGDFISGKKRGQGRCEFTNGDLYSGEFYNNKFHGFGEFTWQSGKVYKGSWNKGLMHGQGTISWPSGKEFRGNFIKGQKHGIGEYTKLGVTKTSHWENGKMSEST